MTTRFKSATGFRGYHGFQVLGFVLSVLVARLTVAGDHLEVGLAETDITPPVGFPMAGYFHERLATGTLDPLKAKAIVFRTKNERAALVVCDLVAVSVDLAKAVRAKAAQKTGIPATNIVVSATHSHTAPDYFRELYLHLDGRPSDPKRAAYIRKLIDAPVAAIDKATAAARPALLEAGAANQEAAVSFNRRFVMRDGSVRTWMKLDHPDVVRAAGPIDPKIGVVVVRDKENSRTRGVVSNFALHLDTVGGSKWSADYPFYIAQTLRDSTASTSTAVSLFTAGCCGDINHVDPRRRERNKTDFIGKSLGRTVASRLGRLRKLKTTTLRVRSRTVSLPLQKVTKEDVSEALRTLAAVKKGEKVDFYAHVTARKRVALNLFWNGAPGVASEQHISSGLSHTWTGVGGALPVEVHAICLGDEVAIVCLPGEVFVELGLAIQRGSPFPTTIVIELSNCAETYYIPNRAAYAQGGYEVTNSTLRPGAGEMLVEAALRLLREAASAATREK